MRLTEIIFRPAFVMAIMAATPVVALPTHTPLECVPFARATSGIQIYGNALTWWDQAAGKYLRGNQPRKGAVLAFKPHGAMRLGHVATVSSIVDDRTILISHANWSPINGARGQIERNVKVIDVSSAGDWSAVRVWYAPLQDIGGTVWPVNGFIYPDGFAPTNQQWAAQPAPKDIRPTGRLAYLGKLLPTLN
jgi:surface antigen